MNNERYNQIIKEVYSKYLDYLNEHQIYGTWYDDEKSFEKECKADKEFAEIWGLKIEERELSLQERKNLYDKSFYTKDIFPTDENGWNSMFDDNNIPTKLITLTYNNEKTEIYE